MASISETDLSFMEAASDEFKLEHLVGSDVKDSAFNVSIIQTQLSRHLASLCPDIKDEIVNVFNELLDITGNEWKTVPAFESVCQIVARACNRVFVGLPLCRNSGWNDLNIRLPYAIGKEALVLHFFPSFIQPNLQNDFLQWCLDFGKESSQMLQIHRIIDLNFAANGTVTNIFTQALYNLAANPQYALLLREEVERIVKEYGWTKEALGKMRRTDSFLKETMRCEGLGWLTVKRKALKDIRLSDGTFIPKDTITQVAMGGIHHDPDVYDNADVFEPFRYSDLGGEQEGSKYQLVAVNSASLGFGYGKLACPGRFFAAIILKMMLAHIVSSFDVRLDENGPPPKNVVFARSIMPDPKARVMFRKRADQ
ncbi:hypothetical protein ID866_8783 [Astraeus odoratus]|nr:hypothetical protein ID866_8783 [Astraeus odoratus]